MKYLLGFILALIFALVFSCGIMIWVMIYFLWEMDFKRAMKLRVKLFNQIIEESEEGFSCDIVTILQLGFYVGMLVFITYAIFKS